MRFVCIIRNAIFRFAGNPTYRFPYWQPLSALFFKQCTKLSVPLETRANCAGWWEKLGHSKVKEFCQWQVKHNYRRLEKDARPDFLPDSDFYGGATGVNGSELEFKLGLAKHVSFGADYYFDVKSINGDTDQEQKVLQADLVIKW